MQKSHLHSILAAACAIGCQLASIQSVSAATSTYYWAPSGTGIGGSGSWDPANVNWATNASGTPVIAWPNVGVAGSGDTAVFGGTGGTVTVSGTQNLGMLQFDAGGYTLTGGTLNFWNSTLTSSNVSGTTTIGSNIFYSGADATVRFRSLGSGELIISGNIDAAASKSLVLQMGGTTSFGTGILRFSGTVSSNISQISIGGLPGNSSDATSTYYLSGDNSSLTGPIVSTITSGTTILQHAKGLGNTGIQVGDNFANVLVGVPVTSALLTDGPLTVTNTINVGRLDAVSGPATSVRTIGGSTADASTFSGAVSFRNQGANRLTAAAGGTVTFSGLLSTNNNGSFTGTTQGIEKIGDGTVIFSRAAGNTYTGGTTVSAGTLLITNTTNSATGGGDITVAGGATFGGAGRAAPTAGNSLDVASNGMLMAGNGVTPTGILTIAGDVNLADNSVIVLTLGASATSHSTLNRESGSWVFDSDQSFFFMDAGVDAITYTGILTGFVADPGVGSWTISNPGWTGTFSYNAVTDAVDLTITAVPEPGSLALLGLGFGLLLRRKQARC